MLLFQYAFSWKKGLLPTMVHIMCLNAQTQMGNTPMKIKKPYSTKTIAGLSKFNFYPLNLIGLRNPNSEKMKSNSYASPGAGLDPIGWTFQKSVFGFERRLPTVLHGGMFGTNKL